ncbi:MAG: lytic transglycosylase domain-containing protein [Paucibacter sp.]|nr:lytic transglycosylase domain-containing protein [Roseateles sp.]
MDATAFVAVATACSPQVDIATSRALVATESAFNPWAIGVVNGALERQPRTRSEALATARMLQASGANFSVGLGQINRSNFERLGLTLDAAFQPCANLAAMQSVLMECFAKARDSPSDSEGDQAALRRALSCYYSGNFATGFRQGYVRKVLAASAAEPPTRLLPLPQENP